MNLVEQQEKARALPMQYLQQAANGQSVELAPWIATAELQRRTTADQHMQSVKGPQGPQPTVKDQVEQKAGLMATQAAQIAQAAQAQQNSPPPGPIPEGVPQPEPQPEEPVMAAHGGLMNAPVSFHFAHGGILGYAGDDDGSYVDPASGTAIQRMPEQDAPAANSGFLGLFNSEPEWKKAARARARGERYTPPPGYNEEGLPIKTQAPAPRREKQDRAPLPSLQGIKAALPKPPPVGGPRRAPTPPMEKPQVEQAPAQAPAPAPAQAPADTQMAPAGLAALKYATEPAPVRTQQDAITDMRALRKESGADQPIGVNEAAQQAAQDAAQKRQQEQAKKLAWAAYVQGTVGTPGSASLAYEQTMANALGNESEYGQQKYKNIADLEGARRGLTKEHQTGLESAVAADRLANANAAKDRATTGANLFNAAEQTRANIYGTNEQSKSSKYNTDEHVKSALAIAKLQERANNARHGSTEHRLALQDLRDREASYDNDIKAMETQLRTLAGSFRAEDRAAMKTLNEQINNARDLKARVRGGPAAAAAPAPTARLKFDAQGNQIK
jgi:hypothetical protein